MFIVMHCMGLPFNGNTIKEQSLGGSESACYYVARELATRGHRVSVFTNHQEGGEMNGVHYAWVGQVNENFPLGERFMHYAVNTPLCPVNDFAGPQSFGFSFLRFSSADRFSSLLLGVSIFILLIFLNFRFNFFFYKFFIIIVRIYCTWYMCHNLSPKRKG